MSRWWLQLIADLRAENARLREALEDVDGDLYLALLGEGDGLEAVQRRVREALSSTSTPGAG